MFGSREDFLFDRQAETMTSIVVPYRVRANFPSPFSAPRVGDLHEEVGGYPGSDHRMPSCCSVMRGEMASGDAVVHQPPKGDGANLVIRFRLPRAEEM